MHPYREIGLAGPGVGLFGKTLDGKASEAKREEAQQIAAYCRHALMDGWEVAERVPGTDEERARPAEFRDIAILLPTRSILGARGAQAVDHAGDAAGVAVGVLERRPVDVAQTGQRDPRRATLGTLLRVRVRDLVVADVFFVFLVFFFLLLSVLGSAERGLHVPVLVHDLGRLALRLLLHPERLA